MDRPPHAELKATMPTIQFNSGIKKGKGPLNQQEDREEEEERQKQTTTYGDPAA